MADSPLLSVSSYAKHRGDTRQAVEKAIKTGRLQKSLTRDAKGRSWINPELADQEWAQNTDYTDAPQRAPEAVESDDSIAGASAREKHWRAKLAELKFKEAAGELVSAKEVERKWSDVLTTVKTRLLGIPTRAKQQCPELTVGTIAKLDDLIRETLQELSNG